MGIFDIFGGLFGIGTANDHKELAQQTQATNNAELGRYWDYASGALQPGIDRGAAAGGQYNALLMGNDPAAFERYKQSAGYDTTLKAGVNALSQNAALRGQLHSGGTLKAASDYGQETNQRYFSDYLGKLGLPMQLGASNANALAGSAGDFANATVGNNWTGASGVWNAGTERNNAFGRVFGGLGDIFGAIPGVPKVPGGW